MWVRKTKLEPEIKVWSFDLSVKYDLWKQWYMNCSEVVASNCMSHDCVSLLIIIFLKKLSF